MEREETRALKGRKDKKEVQVSSSVFYPAPYSYCLELPIRI